MLQFFKDLSIRIKISGFIIPSTIAFGMVMTLLSLFFLNDYKNTSIEEFTQVIQQIKQEEQQSLAGQDIEQMLLQINNRADKQLRNMTLLTISIVIIVIVLATIGALIISYLIGKPVERVATGLENISSGDADLTQRLPVSANDETGRVSHFFNIFLEKLQNIIAGIQSSSKKLVDETTSIHTHITVIQEKGASAREVSQTVFRSAGYMSRDMKEISSVLEESTTNIHTISSAVEQLTNTVTEISSTTSNAHGNTVDARQQMELLENEVQELGKAGQDISNVTETIAEISEQVNLLALNATIEAARAGEAGKGFAVVANEIKELASQTSHAATEIQDKINHVQQVTQTTVTGIVEAAKAVSANTDSVSTIATAVEQQTATVGEISGSLNNALEKLDYSNNKVSKASEHADHMAAMANSVTDSVIEVDDTVVFIREASETLKGLAEGSAKMTQQFRTS